MRLYPDRPALRTPSITYTYAVMNARANAIARSILAVSGDELAQAALLLPNSPEVIISILGTLKAHKCYVPLDPNFPQDRLRIMFEDAEPSVLITDDEHLPLAAKLVSAGTPIVNISAIPAGPNMANPDIPVDPMERAYILYTSGSTGRPKGIEFLHRNLVHHTMGLVNNLFFSPSDRVTWLHSSSFAASIVDIYCCLMAGGTLYPWDVKTQGFIGLADWLVQERVTTFQWIPSAFRQFLRTVPEDFVFENIRIVVMASEPLTLREVELFRRHFPRDSCLVNQLGTSEAGNYRLFPVDHEIAIESPNVPGGYPPSDERRVVILDEEYRPLPAGSVGEIGVQSDFMCRGYWRDDALNQTKFIQVGADPSPVYLTGDLGRIEPDGCLIHLGRKDFQVKIRGHRVELAEVDQAIAAAPGVADAAAWVVKNQLGEEQLVGYIVPPEGTSPDERVIARYVESRLPAYMLPARYVVLDRLPMLPTGKTDRKSLPSPYVDPGSASSSPQSDSGSVAGYVIGLFEELLQRKPVSLDLNFANAGGDSLLTAVLLQRTFQRFAVKIPADVFLKSPTPSHLIGLIGEAMLASGSTAGRIDAPSGNEIRPLPVTRRFPGLREDAAIPQNLIIISAGGFAREVLSWAMQAIAAGARYRIKGFLDNRKSALDGLEYGVKVFDPGAYEVQKDDVFAGALGDPKEKIEYYSPIIEQGGRFVNVIHPTVTFGNNVRLGAGIVIGPYTAINSDASLGDHVAIGTFVNVGHDAVVGDWCHLASHSGVNGRAAVGDAVFVGSHACVLPGVRVGNWSLVGAGSVVVRDVPPNVKVFGNPAAAIGSR